MTTNMTVFEIYAQLEGIYNKYKAEVNSFIAYAKANNKIMGRAAVAVHESSIKYLAQQTDIDPADSLFDERARKQILEAKALPSYSVMNVLAWIKRFKRLEDEFSLRYHRYKQAVRDADKALEKIQGQFTYKQRKNEQIKERVMVLESEFMAEQYAGFEWERSDADYYATINYLSFKISKNDMLSLFNLRHEGWEREYIDKLPDVITPKDFETAAFVYKLEADNDCAFFDVYFDNFMRAIKSSKETSDMAFDVFQEVFGPVPTYNVVADSSGKIVSMKQNKPNLKVISTVRKKE